VQIILFGSAFADVMTVIAWKGAVAGSRAALPVIVDVRQSGRAYVCSSRNLAAAAASMMLDQTCSSGATARSGMA
jgi:hypothetical protein